MKPKYPIYIVSKGRWEKTLTVDALNKMHLNFFVVVEEGEFEKYANSIGAEKLITLPKHYLENYITCDSLGIEKSKGPGAARNFAWDHSISLGADKHWVLDDNIDGFHRLNHNLKIKCESSGIFAAAENFVDRYINVPLAGFNYSMFAKRKDSAPPFVLNTRIYSCLLIDNSLKYRWEGRYNEDTHLSLRVLKNGMCTVQFNTFLQNKIRTQSMGGGNTEAFYEKEGTLPKSEMLAMLHPDVAKVVWKFDRFHHFVDYNSFKKNKLIKIVNTDNLQKVNNYGMVLGNV